MIELLGQAAVNTAVKAGLDRFFSAFRSVPTRVVAGEMASTSPRSYVTTRGILLRREDVMKPAGNWDPNDWYYFQFNPDHVTDTKGTEYSIVPYPGLNYNDYAWSHGGERIITFQLFLDDTPQSHTAGFRPTAYGSHLASSPEIPGATDSSYKLTKESFFGRQADWAKNSLVDEWDTLKNEAMAQFDNIVNRPPRWKWSQTDAFSRTRMSERGVMDVVEKITQFLYPAYVSSDRPRFASGGIVDNTQFRPPSTAILVMGPRYFEGIVKSAPVEYTLFDTDLTPIRATINIEFAAYEFAEIRAISEQIKTLAQK